MLKKITSICREHYIKLVIGIALLSIAIPFLLYRIIFNGDFSITSEDWGNFGSFYNFISPILMFINLLIISYSLKKQNEFIDREIQSSHIPLVFFASQIVKYKKSETEELFEILENAYYKGNTQDNALALYNIGKGAALNVKVFIQFDSDAIVETINKDIPEAFHIKKEDDWYRLSPTYRIQLPQRPYQFDFILPSSSPEEKVPLFYPFEFIKLIGYYSKVLDEESIVPIDDDKKSINFTILLQYSDIYETQIKREFDVSFAPLYGCFEKDAYYFDVSVKQKEARAIVS